MITALLTLTGSVSYSGLLTTVYYFDADSDAIEHVLVPSALVEGGRLRVEVLAYNDAMSEVQIALGLTAFVRNTDLHSLLEVPE